MAQISVIIPVYNVLPYLNRCVESVLAQTFSDYELILVDDGSTDGSDVLCDQWAERDPRIRVYHTTNHGQAAARNFGVQKANAPLVTFIDSDDTVSPYYLEYHLRALTETLADCSIALHRRVTEQTEEAVEEEPSYHVMLLPRKQVMHEMAAKELRASEWNILAPRAWYLEIPLPEGMYYEDRAHVHKLLLRATSIAYVDTVLYYYLIRNNSTLYSQSSSIKLCRDFQKAIQIAQSDLKDSGMVSDEDIAVMVCRDCISLYLTTRRCSEAPEKASEIGAWALGILRQYGTKAMSNASAPKSVRFRIGLILVSPKIYRILDSIAKKRKGWVC